MNDEFDLRLPSCPVWINGQFATLWDDGSIEFYSEGDLKISLKDLRQFIFKADRFMQARHLQISNNKS